MSRKRVPYFFGPLCKIQGEKTQIQKLAQNQPKSGKRLKPKAIPSYLGYVRLITRPCTTVRDSEDILEQSPFQKYTTCWVFLALYFAFAHLTHGNIIFDTLEQSFFKEYTAIY